MRMLPIHALHAHHAPFGAKNNLFRKKTIVFISHYIVENFQKILGADPGYEDASFPGRK